MQLRGKLVQSTPVEQISDSFKKTNVIIQTEFDSQYPQEIVVECHNDNIAKLKEAAVKAGDIVTLDFNLRGKRYVKDGQPDKWFNTIVMWKITKEAAGSVAPVAAPVSVSSDNDDLPFS